MRVLWKAFSYTYQSTYDFGLNVHAVSYQYASVHVVCSHAEMAHFWQIRCMPGIAASNTNLLPCLAAWYAPLLIKPQALMAFKKQVGLLLVSCWLPDDSEFFVVHVDEAYLATAPKVYAGDLGVLLADNSDGNVCSRCNSSRPSAHGRR